MVRTVSCGPFWLRKFSRTCVNYLLSSNFPPSLVVQRCLSLGYDLVDYKSYSLLIYLFRRLHFQGESLPFADQYVEKITFIYKCALKQLLQVAHQFNKSIITNIVRNCSNQKHTHQEPKEHVPPSHERITDSGIEFKYGVGGYPISHAQDI